MKISEFTTDTGLDVLCELVPHAGAIITDDDLKAELRRKLNLEKDATQAEIYAAGLDKLSKLIPIVLKKRRDEVYALLAILNETTVDTIKRQNFLKTAAEIRDVVKDKELMDFFKSLRSSENN